MKNRITQRTPTEKLVHRVRLMAETGGNLTRDRVKTLLETADRLEELDERVSIMTENEPITQEGR